MGDDEIFQAENFEVENPAEALSPERVHNGVDAVRGRKSERLVITEPGTGAPPDGEGGRQRRAVPGRAGE